METFELQAKQAAAGLVNVLTAITPVFLIAAIVGVAVFNGWLEYIHYRAVIGSLAWIPGFIFAGMRFGSGLGGIHMFKSGQGMRGMFFLAVSVGLTFWTSAHAPQMAESIAIDFGQRGNAEWFVKTCLWVALLGELMIATYMGAHASEAKRAATEGATVPPQRVATPATQPPATAQPAPQRPFRNDPGNGATYNETPAQQIGFRMPQRSETEKAATGAKRVGNGVSKLRDDGVLLAEQLERARRNLSAFQSKLRNEKGNVATNERGVARWTQRVAELEAQLQDATD